MPRSLDPAIVSALGSLGVATRDLAAGKQRHDDALLRRARHLDRPDRMLFEASVVRGLSTRHLAALMQVHAGTVARRLTSIRRRLTDPRVAAVVDAGNPLTPTDRAIAIGHLLRRRTIGELARETSRTPPIVRQRLIYVRGWLQGRRDAAFALRQARAA